MRDYRLRKVRAWGPAIGVIATGDANSANRSRRLSGHPDVPL